MESAASYAAFLAGKTGRASPDVPSKRMSTISALHGTSKKDERIGFEVPATLLTGTAPSIPIHTFLSIGKMT
jgi:hypothetical protein